MKPDAIKLNIKKYINGLIDDIFPNTDLFGKLKAATAKFWVEQNIWRLDDILSQFVDKNGEINTDSAFQFYSESIFDEQGRFYLDLQKMVDNESISKYLPNSVILFTKDDLNSVLCK